MTGGRAAADSHFIHPNIHWIYRNYTCFFPRYSITGGGAAAEARGQGSGGDYDGGRVMIPTVSRRCNMTGRRGAGRGSVEVVKYRKKRKKQKGVRVGSYIETKDIVLRCPRRTNGTAVKVV